MPHSGRSFGSAHFRQFYAGSVSASLKAVHTLLIVSSSVAPPPSLTASPRTLHEPSTNSLRTLRNLPMISERSHLSLFCSSSERLELLISAGRQKDSTRFRCPCTFACSSPLQSTIRPWPARKGHCTHVTHSLRLRLFAPNGWPPLIPGESLLDRFIPSSTRSACSMASTLAPRRFARFLLTHSKLRLMAMAQPSPLSSCELVCSMLYCSFSREALHCLCWQHCTTSWPVLIRQGHQRKRTLVDPKPQRSFREDTRTPLQHTHALCNTPSPKPQASCFSTGPCAARAPAATASCRAPLLAPFRLCVASPDRPCKSQGGLPSGCTCTTHCRA